MRSLGRWFCTMAYIGTEFRRPPPFCLIADIKERMESMSPTPLPQALVSLADACTALGSIMGSDVSERWLTDFLRRTKTDPAGLPLYRIACRRKLVYLDRVIEALPCPSSSARRVPAKPSLKSRSQKRLDSLPESELWEHAQWFSEGDSPRTVRRKAALKRSKIYFIQCGQCIKIGVSSDWKSRISSLNTGSASPLKLLALVPRKRKQEQELHRQFAHLRIRHEWFRAADELLKYIEGIQDQCAAAER